MERERDSSSSSSMSNLRFPPGFRFHPSDEELIVHYLQSKATSRPQPASVIAEIDLYKYNPWELPKMALFGEAEWYFFSPRDRKYPKGERPNRAAGLGYWKATGVDRQIFSSMGLSNPIGVKKGLAFYLGRPPKGEKTDWLMSEYRLLDSSIKTPRHKGSMRLDDWVLCRVRYRGTVSKNTHETPGSCSTEKLMPVTKTELNIHTNANCDIIADYLHKDCVLLAWILSGGRAALPGEIIPSVNAEEIIRYEKSLNSYCNNSFNESQLLFPMNNCFNQLNGENYEENDAGCLDREKKIEENLSIASLAETNINGYTENQTQYVNNPMDYFIKFQELNEFEHNVHTCNTEAALNQMT